MGRIIKTLEDCYGIQHGGDRKSNPPMVDLKSQKDIAEQLGINQESYRRTKGYLN